MTVKAEDFDFVDCDSLKEIYLPIVRREIPLLCR